MKSYKNGVFDIALLCSKLSFDMLESVDTSWRII